MATSQRDEQYERGVKRWRDRLDTLTTVTTAHYDSQQPHEEYAELKRMWDRLEASRHVPTREMKHASDKLRKLQETVNLPSKEMKEAKRMVDELTKARDAPIKDMSGLTLSRKEKKYVKNVMKWQDALMNATEKHRKDCTKWAQTLDESKDSKKDMKRVRRMLNRLLDTRGVPTGDMEEAATMLQRLEEERREDAHLIVMRYAGSMVYKLERELMGMRGEINEMKKRIGNTEDFIAWENSMDKSFSEEDDEEEDEEGSGDWFGFGSSFNLFGMFDKDVNVGDNNSVSVTTASVMSS